MYATPKQIQLALSLEVRLRLLDPHAQPVRHAQLVKMSKGEISRHIQALNQHTGFKPSTTRATAPQKKFLETLERELTGTVSHDIDRLTYAEADERIKYYRDLRKADAIEASNMAPVVDLFSKKAV